MSRIDEIKERHSKAQGTPWKMGDYSNDYYTPGYNVTSSDGRMIAEMIEEEEDVQLISNAPTDVQYLLKKLKQVELSLKVISVPKSIQTDEYYELIDKLTEIMVDIQED